MLKKYNSWWLPLVLLISVLGSLFFIWLISVALRTDYEQEIPRETSCISRPPFHLAGLLESWDKQEGHFPYETYLDSADLCDPNQTADNLKILDSLQPENPVLNREILSIALTGKLEKRKMKGMETYHPDSLIRIVQWAEKFNQYQYFDVQNAKLYRVIYKYWINVVANKLREYYEISPNNKYDFKFRYLSAVCESKNLSAPVGNTNLEKITYNMIHKNYTYLFTRFWYGTGPVYKILLALLAAITIYGYYCIYKLHFQKKSGQNPEM